MESYTAGEARLHMRDILSAAERGEQVVIKRYETPTALVVPIEWAERARAALGELPLDITEPKENVR
jgi:antitoxin (DNA-binding transcriptional repressor) of toxin-antitoxin stability system